MNRRSCENSDQGNPEFVSEVIWDPNVYFTERNPPKIRATTSANTRSKFVRSSPSGGNTLPSSKDQHWKKTPDSRRVLKYKVNNFKSESKYDKIVEQKLPELERRSKPEPKIHQGDQRRLTRPQAASSDEPEEPQRPCHKIDLPSISAAQKVNLYLADIESSAGSGSLTPEAPSVLESTTTTGRPTPAKKPSIKPPRMANKSKQSSFNGGALHLTGPTEPPVEPYDYLHPTYEFPRFEVLNPGKFYITQCETEDVGEATFCSTEQLKKKNGMLNVIVISKATFEYKSKRKDKMGQPTGPLIEYTETLEEFQEKINQGYECKRAKDDKIRVYECFPRGYYCVKDGENWYRIQVMAGGGREDTQVKAFFIDRGVVKYVKKVDLRFIHKAFTYREAFDEDFRYKARAFHAQINLKGCGDYVKEQIVAMAGADNTRWFEHEVEKVETHNMEFPLLTLGPPEDI